jgi:hypothetical protein
MPQPRQWSSLPYMSHESQLRDTLFIIAEPDSRSMAVDLHGIYVTCFHCQESAQSCLLGAGDAHHCLVAQGWFKSPAKSKNWSCPTCATGYWVAPNEDLVKCCHLETLQYRKRGMIEWRLTTEAAAGISRDARSGPHRNHAAGGLRRDRAGTGAHGQPPHPSGRAPAVSEAWGGRRVTCPRVAQASGGRRVSGIGKQAHTIASSTQAHV